MLRTALAAVEPGLLALAAVLPEATGQLALGAAVALLAFGPGRRLLPADTGAHPLEEAALAVTTGLALFSALALALAACGVYSAGLLACGVLFAQVAAVPSWRRLLQRLLQGLRSETRAPASTLLALVLGAAPTALFAAALSLYPPHLDDDSAYHLPYTRAFLDTGGLPFLADLRFPTFPQLQELSWGPLLAWAGDAGVTALVLAQTLLVAALVAGVAARWAGRGAGRGAGTGARSAAAGTGALAGAAAAGLWLGSPYVVLYGTAAFVDTALALFVAAAFACIDLAGADPGLDAGAPEVGRPRAEAPRVAARWLAVAGLLAGTAAASKGHGLVFLLLALAAGLLTVRPWRPLSRIRPLWWMAAVALLAAGPTYLHLARLTGNPVFPLLPQIFGDSPWALEHLALETGPHLTQLDRVSRRAAAVDPSLADHAADLLELPAWLALRPGPEWGPPPFNPALLLAMPVVLWTGLLVPAAGRRRLLIVAVVVVSYGVLWFHTGRDPRYLFPAAALVAPAAGAAVARLLDRTRHPLPARSAAPIASMLLLLLAAPGTAYAAHRLAVDGAPPTTAADRDTFLDHHLPGHRALRRLERDGAAEPACTVYALGGGPLQHHSPCRLLGEVIGPARYGLYGPLLATPDRLLRELADLGATHLLLVAPYAAPADVERLIADRRLHLLHRDPRAALFALPGAKAAGRPSPR